ncbi:MAG: ATP-binding cassette domain-containing protein [Propionibacteriaceae bacterium]|nr:ATP-binding cassette domain-containing protein [Propionibacteriaceae bacterium]
MSIVVNSLGVSLGGLPIVKDISFQIESGHVVGVLGSNGSGKTTLIKAMLGLLPCTGEVKILGQPITTFNNWKKIGYVPQRSSVSLHSTTTREVVESGLLAGRSWGWVQSNERRHAQEVLDIVGLSNHGEEPYLHLSGGQQQRVLIARGIVHQPEILIMDEPFAGVDLDHQRDIIARLSGMGATIVVVLHETTLWANVLDRTLILREGRLVYDQSLRGDHPLGDYSTTSNSMDSATNAQNDKEGHAVGTVEESLLTGMEPRWTI